MHRIVRNNPSEPVFEFTIQDLTLIPRCYILYVLLNHAGPAAFQAVIRKYKVKTLTTKDGGNAPDCPEQS